MSNITTNIEFNLSVALSVIEQDNDLDEIFRNGTISTPYNVLQVMVKQNTIPNEINERIVGIFEHIILGNQKPRMAYLKLLKAQTDAAIISDIPIKDELIAETQLNILTPEKVSNDAKPKLPKHYGKEKILKDIEENNGKSELDITMLALNDLRNIYAKLKNRCIKDKLRGTNNLTTADCREIVAVVRILQNKLQHIIDK